MCIRNTCPTFFIKVHVPRPKEYLNTCMEITIYLCDIYGHKVFEVCYGSHIYSKYHKIVHTFMINLCYYLTNASIYNTFTIHPIILFFQFIKESMSLLVVSGGNLLYILSNTTYFIRKPLSVIHLFTNGPLKLEHTGTPHIISLNTERIC